MKRRSSRKPPIPINRGRRSGAQEPSTDPRETASAPPITLSVRAALAVAVFLISALVYANTLSEDFSFTLDDVPIIEENELIADLSNIPRFFTTNYWGESEKFTDKGLYRPLVITSYALNYAVGGLSTPGYHAVNIALHAVAGILLLFLVLQLTRDLWTAFIAAVLFAVHPIHTEVVAGIVGRAEIMALVGTLACCLLYLRAMEPVASEVGGQRHIRSTLLVAGSIIAFAGGCFSKEIGVVAPAVIILCELMMPRRRALLRGRPAALIAFAGYAVVAVTYLNMRAAAISGMSISIGYFGISAADRFWTAMRVCFEYVMLMLAPIRLSADYWVSDVPIAASPFEPGVLAALAVLAAFIALIAWSWRTSARGNARWILVGWGLAFFLVTLFPVSNLVRPIGVMKAERLLYTPSAGFLAAVAALAAAALRRRRLRLFILPLLIGVVVAASIRSWMRNYDWKDNRTLAEVTLRASPNSVIFNTIMATCYREAGDNVRARPHLERALEGQSDNTIALYNLGNIELDEKRYDRAVELYRRALALKPGYISALNNLGRALSEAKRYDEAIAPLEKSRSLLPDNPASYVNLLAIYVQTRNVEVGIPLAEEALRRFPDVAAVYWNAGSMFGIAGRAEEGRALHKKAAELDGDNPQTDIRTDLE